MSDGVKSEVAEQLDLSVIRYSRVWEDYRSLVKGLEICSQDSLLVISRLVRPHLAIAPASNLTNSSGDNVLNLLLEEPREIS